MGITKHLSAKNLGVVGCAMLVVTCGKWMKAW